MTENKKKLVADFCVMGGGAAGLSFAAGAAQMGASVILLEKHIMGGDCLNTGCVPSKALIAAAKIGYSLQKSEAFGWKIRDTSLDFTKVHQHVHRVISTIARNDSVERFSSLGVQVIQEAGSFVNTTQLETQSYSISAKKYIIATGSTPFIPPIPGLEAVNFYTNETIFNLSELPRHLCIVGGGPIGMEMAQAFSRLGSQVTILENGYVLPKDDHQLSSVVKNALMQEGVRFFEKSTILSVKNHNNEIECTYTVGNIEQTIVASHVLIAAGRRPNIGSVGCQQAGVICDPKGIKVNSYLQTTNKRIYAIGDCIGGYQFTHVAGYHASVVLQNAIFKIKKSVKTHAIPWVTYTDPELAQVGFLEKELQDKKIKHTVLKMNFSENDRAQAQNRTEGIIKVLVSKNGYVLGASIVGLNAGELIYPWVMAIQNNLKISAIANSLAPYPTLNDINKRIAGSYYTPILFGEKMKKIVKFLLWF